MNFKTEHLECSITMEPEGWTLNMKGPFSIRKLIYTNKNVSEKEATEKLVKRALGLQMFKEEEIDESLLNE